MLFDSLCKGSTLSLLDCASVMGLQSSENNNIVEEDRVRVPKLIRSQASGEPAGSGTAGAFPRAG